MKEDKVWACHTDKVVIVPDGGTKKKNYTVVNKEDGQQSLFSNKEIAPDGGTNERKDAL